MIEIRGLKYEYKLEGVSALNGINLKIGKGRTTLIGQNGSGKTTLLKCIAGLLKPSEGKIFVNNVELNEKTLYEIWQKVVLIPQDPADILISGTVEGEVSFSLFGSQLKEEIAEERVRYSMREMGIEEIKDKVSHRLSTGEKKKVALAIALAVQPEILLVDEPTANLDPKSTRQILEILKRLDKKGINILLATNDLGVASEWGGHVILLKKGKIVAEGEGEILKNNALLEGAGLL